MSSDDKNCKDVRLMQVIRLSFPTWTHVPSMVIFREIETEYNSAYIFVYIFIGLTDHSDQTILSKYAKTIAITD